MPELVANDVNRHALGDELGRVRVAHLVGHDAPLDPGLRGGPGEHGPGVLRGHRAAAESAQQHPAADAPLAPLVGLPLDGGHRAGIQADRPRLEALAVHDADGAALGVDVGGRSARASLMRSPAL